MPIEFSIKYKPVKKPGELNYGIDPDNINFWLSDGSDCNTSVKLCLDDALLVKQELDKAIELMIAFKGIK